MVVSIYLKPNGKWSFRREEGAEALRVKVPGQSEVKEVKSVGAVLFVPGPDPLIRAGWNPDQVVSEANKVGGRFSVVPGRKLARVG